MVAVLLNLAIGSSFVTLIAQGRNNSPARLPASIAAQCHKKEFAILNNNYNLQLCLSNHTLLN